MKTRGHQIVKYADDVVIVNKQRRVMGEVLDELAKYGERIGHKINMEKTKIMANERRKITGKI